jgi:hypothetical protein
MVVDEMPTGEADTYPSRALFDVSEIRLWHATVLYNLGHESSLPTLAQ